jgi:hypothetical protein
MSTHPPLAPTETGERQFFHYRRNILIEILTMDDALAIYRIQHGQDLWPAEWGMRQTEINRKETR